MVNIIGMDVAQMSSVARSLAQASDEVEQITRVMDQLVDRSLQQWQGGDAFSFSQSWRSGMRPNFLAASQTLDDMARQVSQHIAEQETASGRGADSAGGGQPGSGPWSSRDPGSGPGFENPLDPAFMASIAGYLYGDVADGGSDLAKWVAAHLSGVEMTTLKSGAEILKYAGFAAGSLSAVMNLHDAFTAYEAGRGWEASGEGLHALGDAIGLVPHNPVTKLSSVALHAFGETLVQAQQVDVAAAPQTFAYAATNPNVVVEELGKATLQVGKDLVGWIL